MCEKGDNDMGIVIDKKMEELRKQLQSMNKDFPVLNKGEKDAIELDPKNPSDVEWYEGR